MTTSGSDYYILPTTWCDACRCQVSCGALVWEVADEHLVTFACPKCGKTLGVGLHGETAWSAHHAGRRRGGENGPES